MKELKMDSSAKPVKKLTHILKKHSGRDSSGQVSIMHRGGRQKRHYRLIDFKHQKDTMKGTVVSIEYDPNRTANIALVEYTDGVKNYIIASQGMNVSDVVMSGTDADVKSGNTMSLSQIPLGTEIHNIELYPGNGGQMIKSAGSFAVLIAKDGLYADIKLPSKEVRKVRLTCRATIGRVGYGAHKLEKIGKAGRKRHMGIRPSVRGTAQNPHSHPHGGGEGRSGEAMPPKTRQGKLAHGGRTRHKKKWSNKLVVKRRK